MAMPLLLVVAIGCGPDRRRTDDDPPLPTDAGLTDAGEPFDAGERSDGGDALDAGEPSDAGTPLDGGSPPDGGTCIGDACRELVLGPGMLVLDSAGGTAKSSTHRHVHSTGVTGGTASSSEHRLQAGPAVLFAD